MGVHRADQPHVPPGAGQPVELGHPAVRRLGLQLGQRLQNPGVGQEGILGKVSAVVHGHHLNEPHGHGIAQGQRRQCLDFIVVKAADENAVDLHGPEARLQRRFQPCQSLLQLPHPGDVGVFLRVQGVQADIHPLHPRLLQRLCQLGQQHAVGGDAQLPDPLHLSRPAADGKDVPLYQRLAAGDPQLGDSQGGGGLHRLNHLILGKHILVPLFADPFFGHAVPAPEVAQLRYRQAHIMDPSSVLIVHGSSHTLLRAVCMGAGRPGHRGSTADPVQRQVPGVLGFR